MKKIINTAQEGMTVEQILDKMLNDTLDYVERMEKVNSPVLFLGKYKSEALAAIEAHYAAIRKADMEYVAGEIDLYDSKEVRQYIKSAQERMNQRLNNTEEVCGFHKAMWEAREIYMRLEDNLNDGSDGASGLDSAPVGI